MVVSLVILVLMLLTERFASKCSSAEDIAAQNGNESRTTTRTPYGNIKPGHQNVEDEDVTNVHTGANKTHILGYISNHKNSCYLDSLLMALLHKPNNPFITNFLTSSSDDSDDNRKTLQNLLNTIAIGIQQKHETNKLNQLRNDLRLWLQKNQQNSQGDNENFSSAQNDSNKVLEIFLKVLESEKSDNTTLTYTLDERDKNYDPANQSNAPAETKKTHFNLSLTPGEANFVQECVDNEDTDIICIPQNYQFTNPGKKQGNTTVGTSKNHKYNLTQNEKGLIFVRINRVRPPSDINDTSVFLLEKVSPNLELSSVVVHDGTHASGGHYVCCFKHTDDRWYQYNDTSGFTPLNTWTEIQTRVNTKTTLAIYFEQNKTPEEDELYTGSQNSQQTSNKAKKDKKQNQQVINSSQLATPAAVVQANQPKKLNEAEQSIITYKQTLTKYKESLQNTKRVHDIINGMERHNKQEKNKNLKKATKILADIEAHLKTLADLNQIQNPLKSEIEKTISRAQKFVNFLVKNDPSAVTASESGNLPG